MFVGKRRLHLSHPLKLMSSGFELILEYPEMQFAIEEKARR